MSIPSNELEAQRVRLTGYCYRMLGSVVDADDAVQETMVRAWRSISGFDERSSLRTWLYKIATNVCLDALSDKSRRERPVDLADAGSVDDALETRPREHWLEPIADARAVPRDVDPAERLILNESIRLAFVAAIQYLPPKQRAVLLLKDVLGCSAVEVAECLELTVPAVTSALQRARATLESRNVHAISTATLSDEEAALVDQYATAFERFDIDALTALLREDVTMSMPPHSLWLQGRASIAAWFNGRGLGCRGSRLIRTAAAGSPALGQYRDGGKHPWALIVLVAAEGQITEITSFLDTETLFPRFELPASLA